VSFHPHLEKAVDKGLLALAVKGMNDSTTPRAASAAVRRRLALLLMATQAACCAAQQLVNVSNITIPDTPISAGNPFFHESGRPYYLTMPYELSLQLVSAGCAYAWRRQQHHTSQLDRACTSMAKPFFSQRGGLLGFLNATVNQRSPPDGFMTVLGDPITNTTHITTVTTEDITMNGADGLPIVNLSSLGWTGPTPLILFPDQNKTLAQLYATPREQLQPLAYFYHQVGAWAYEWAGGGPNASDADNRVALKQAAELWLYLANHAKQNDTTKAFLSGPGHALM
jgi:hypothetical protein